MPALIQRFRFYPAIRGINDADISVRDFLDEQEAVNPPIIKAAATMIPPSSVLFLFFFGCFSFIFVVLQRFLYFGRPASDFFKKAGST